MSSNIKCSSHLSFFFCLRIPNTRSNLQPILSFFTSNASWYRWNQKQNWFWYIFSFVDRYRQTSALLFLRWPLWYQPLRRYFFFVEIYKQVFLIFVFHWADAAELEKLGVKSVPSTLIEATLGFVFCSTSQQLMYWAFRALEKDHAFLLEGGNKRLWLCLLFLFSLYLLFEVYLRKTQLKLILNKRKKNGQNTLRPTPYEYMHYFDA